MIRRVLVGGAGIIPAALFVCVFGTGSPVSGGDNVPAPAKRERLRRPVALAMDEFGERLYVANRRAGTVTVLETAGRRVTGEIEVGRRLADAAWVAGRNRLIVVDEGGNQIVVLRPNGPLLEPVCRVAVADYPVSIRVSSDGTRAYVASLWSRVLSVLDLAAIESPRMIKTIQLPFAPREQLLVANDKRLLVADGFQGRFVVFDTENLDVQRILKIAGHNIRGLALSPDGRNVYVSHMILNQLAETTRQSVFWGVVMTNNVRSLSLQALLSAGDPPLKDALVHFLGDPGRATGDPDSIAVCPDGTVVVALGGVNEVGVGAELPNSFGRTAVGRRPAAVVCDAQGRLAYAANTLSDSISIVDIAKIQTIDEISLGAGPELSLADQGELLFYDANRSLDGWYSCHSCHTDGHTTGLLLDNLGDGNFGAPKRILSLLGVAQTGPWAWNGSISQLPSQVHKSMVSTMQGPAPSEAQVAALTAFIKSLPFAPAAVESAGEAVIARGKAVFGAQRCARCHEGPTYTSPKVFDVRTEDEQGQRRFNPPALRGLAQGGPYLHDNRAETLHDLFSEHGHQLRGELAAKELDDLVEFLRSL